MIRWYDYINSSMEIAAEWGRGPRGVMWDVAEVDGVEVPKLLTVTPEVLAANGGYKTQQEFRNAESFSVSLLLCGEKNMRKMQFMMKMQNMIIS